MSKYDFTVKGTRRSSSSLLVEGDSFHSAHKNHQYITRQTCLDPIVLILQHTLSMTQHHTALAIQLRSQDHDRPHVHLHLLLHRYLL